MTHEEDERIRAVAFKKHLDEHRRSKDSYCVAKPMLREECDNAGACWCDESAMGITPYGSSFSVSCRHSKWIKWGVIIFVAHFAVDVALIAVAAVIGASLW